MRIKKISAVAEYNYDFSKRKEIIIEKNFKNTVTSITDQKKKKDLYAQIYNNNWSALEKIQTTLINSNILTDQTKSEIIDERNFVRKLSLTSFIELDPEFESFASTLLKALEKWSFKHHYLYTENRVLSESDLEDYFLNTHNDFKGDNYKVQIYDNHIEFPSGETLYGITPTTKEKIIIDTLIFNSYDESLLYEIINIIKKIDKSKIKSISKIAYNYHYISYENSPINFLKKLASMQNHDNQSLKEIAAAVQVLSPEWYGDGQDLLNTVEKLFAK